MKDLSDCPESAVLQDLYPSSLLHQAFFILLQHSLPQAMAFWCLDFFQIVFWWLLIALTPCNAELSGNAATLATRDWSDDSYNWHQVMQTLQNVSSRLGIPIGALQSFVISMPIILEVAPNDHLITPTANTANSADELIEVDEGNL